MRHVRINPPAILADDIPTAADETRRECVCGDDATVRVRVEWADGPRRYWYCPSCATDVVNAIEGAEVV